MQYAEILPSAINFLNKKFGNLMGGKFVDRKIIKY